MNDDLIGKVAEAMFRDAWPEVDPTVFDRQAYTQHARAAVAAHTDYLLALGGVTEDAIGEAVSWDYAGKIAHVSILIARAVAQAVADKEQMRVDLLAACEALTAEAQRLAADRDALRAKVARVEALIEPWVSTQWPTRSSLPGLYSKGTEHSALADPIRAALADEDGDA